MNKLWMTLPSLCMALACGGGEPPPGGGTGGGTGGTGGGGGTAASGNAIGGECTKDADCQSRICVGKTGAAYGYCSKVCESFSDCPSFWDCKSLSNASAKYCVK